MAKSSIPLTQARLKELLSYDPETGEFTWLTTWRLMKAGELAGSIHKDKGYRNIGIDGQVYRAHRLVFLYVDGILPDLEVDHINRVKDDNRRANLRLGTHAQNMANRSDQARKHDLPRGVYPCKRGYRAGMYMGAKFKHFGVFNTPEEASAVYLQEAQRRFGEFFPS